jgi:hypothetical protein
MAVEMPPENEARVDGFIDDLVNTFLDTPENCRRQPRAGDANESTPWRPILSQPKLLAEGSPAEFHVVLGWTIDTRQMLIALPDDKHSAWGEDLG